MFDKDVVNADCVCIVYIVYTRGSMPTRILSRFYVTDIELIIVPFINEINNVI